MANLIKNMDRGNNMYTKKMDFINDHLRNKNIQKDIAENVR